MPKVTRFCAPQTGDGIAHPKHRPGGLRHDATRRFFAMQFAAVLALAATMACAGHSSAAPLAEADFSNLARDCAPSISPAILRAVAKTESGLDPIALHDDTTGEKDNPTSEMQAQAEASRWMRHGDSVDIGLMQINSANFPALGLSAQTALDPCASLAAGATVLRAAYGGGNTPAEQQVALLLALSRYNTGSPFRGIMNGYARSVLVNVSTSTSQNSKRENKINQNIDPNAPPEWNVSDSGVYAEAHGAPWLIAFSSDTSSTSSAR